MAEEAATIEAPRAPGRSRRGIICWGVILALLLLLAFLCWQFLVPVLRVRSAFSAAGATLQSGIRTRPSSDLSEEAARKAVADLGGAASAVRLIGRVHRSWAVLQPDQFYGLAPEILTACGREGVPELVRAVEERRPFAYMAIVALGRIGAPEAEAVILEVLNDPGCEGWWQEAAGALGRLQSRKSVARLTQILSEHSDLEYRTAAARALGRVGDPKGVPVLLANFDSSKHIRIRGEIRAALVAIGEPALEPLKKALAAEKDRTHRDIIRDTIFQIEQSMKVR